MGLMRRAFLHIVLCCTLPLYAQSGGEWPIANLKLIRTQWSSWIARFFAMDDDLNLVYGRVADQKYSLQRVPGFGVYPTC
jgi:hypothetical protein